MGGWPSVFYCNAIVFYYFYCLLSSVFYLLFVVIGGASLVWFVLWALFMYDRPSEHPRISPEEKNYIEKSIQNPAHSVRNNLTKYLTGC